MPPYTGEIDSGLSRSNKDYKEGQVGSQQRLDASFVVGVTQPESAKDTTTFTVLVKRNATPVQEFIVPPMGERGQLWTWPIIARGVLKLPHFFGWDICKGSGVIQDRVDQCLKTENAVFPICHKEQCYWGTSGKPFRKITS